MILISENLKNQIETQARASYPYECCGIIFGHFEDEDSGGDLRRVQSLQNVENKFEEGEKHHRFKIDSDTLFKAELSARKNKIDIVGFYHSHPDHPAVPSDYDRDNALPGYSYIITSVTKDGIKDFRSWQLKKDNSNKKFLEETWKLQF